MDLDMPEGNGLYAIEQIMALEPTRILVVTSVPRYGGADATFEALSRGALDLIQKPTAWPGTTAEQEDLLVLAERLASVPVIPHVAALTNRRIKEHVRRESVTSFAQAVSLIVVGSSTGGPSAIVSILGELPDDFPVAVVVLQHLADVFAADFIKWLDSKVRLSVREALPGSLLQPGTVHVAIRGSDLSVSSRGRFEACSDSPRCRHRPSIDVLFKSAARSYGSSAMGVLLTGMGRDGAEGLKAIRQAGGITLAQDEASCVVFGMPKAAIEIGAVQRILSTREIAQALLNAAGTVAGNGAASGSYEP